MSIYNGGLEVFIFINDGDDDDDDDYIKCMSVS